MLEEAGQEVDPKLREYAMMGGGSGGFSRYTRGGSGRPGRGSRRW